MNFAGRSKEIVDVSEYRYGGPQLQGASYQRTGSTMLAGSACISRFSAARGTSSKEYPVDCICEMMHGILEENRGKFEHDDIGFIIIDPFRAERVDGTAVIMGGTRPYEEKQYRSEYASGSHDRWVPASQWGEAAGVFAGAGIRALAAGTVISSRRDGQSREHEGAGRYIILMECLGSHE